jgi:hypothetical protein
MNSYVNSFVRIIFIKIQSSYSCVKYSKMKIAVFFFVSLFLALSNLCQAQIIEPVDTIGESLLLRKEIAGSLHVHTLGYGAGFRYGINKSYFNKKMFEFDLLEMHAPNEEKRFNPQFADSRKYVYAKLNNLYMLRGGYGSQRLLNRKPYWGGVEVRAFYYGGAVLGLAKPVFLYIADYTQQGDRTYYDLTVEQYDPEIHFASRGLNPNRDCDIFGKGPLLRGFGRMKPYPGAYGKLGVNVEYGKYNAQLKSVEIGVVADFFPAGVPIMAFQDPFKLFVTGYVSFSFGKRFN